MLISTKYNCIYLSIVTEIDTFMLNLVNLSITSSTEFNNYPFFVVLNVKKSVQKKKEEESIEMRDDKSSHVGIRER